MIFLSVGTQFPFDRLVCAVDAWAEANGRSDIVAQIGPTAYVPRMLKFFPFLDPEEMRRIQIESRVTIAHAGMGSILTALELGKPIIIMPRDHKRGEHRNGHQLATASRFRDTTGVYVVRDELDLTHRLNDLDALVSTQTFSEKAPDVFVSRLRSFIEDDTTTRRGWRRLFQGGGVASLGKQQ